MAGKGGSAKSQAYYKAQFGNTEHNKVQRLKRQIKRSKGKDLQAVNRLVEIQTTPLKKAA